MGEEATLQAYCMNGMYRPTGQLLACCLNEELYRWNVLRRVASIKLCSYSVQVEPRRPMREGLGQLSYVGFLFMPVDERLRPPAAKRECATSLTS